MLFWEKPKLEYIKAIQKTILMGAIIIRLYKIIGEVTDLVMTPPDPPSVICSFENLHQVSFAERQIIGLIIIIKYFNF